MASYDGRFDPDPEYSNITIPDILHEGSEREDEYENVVLRPKEPGDEDDVFDDDSDVASPYPPQRTRRSGVINSTEKLNKLSTADNDDDIKKDVPKFMLSSSSSSNSLQDRENEQDESYEMEDKISNLFPKTNSLGVIYDETRPKRCIINARQNKSDVIYDETKPKRKVSFDTAMPTFKHNKNDMPIRKISLDTGLDLNNIRRINIDSQSGMKLKKQCSNPEVKNDHTIRKISFDEESGTLHIRQISNEDNETPPVVFETSSETPCVTPRKMSYEGDPSDIGYINRGFDNDTYLDNVTFQVQKVYPDIQEKDLNGFSKKSNGNCDRNGYETKGILKGGKSRQPQVTKSSDGPGDKNSHLAEHLRKDSIALTSEKLGQILDLQKHYSQQHMHKKRVSTRGNNAFADINTSICAVILVKFLRPEYWLKCLALKLDINFFICIKNKNL